ASASRSVTARSVTGSAAPAEDLQRGEGSDKIGTMRLLHGMRGTLLAIFLAATAPACTPNPTGPTNSSAFTQTDLVIGTGAAAASGSSLTVNYTGWLYDPSKPDNKGAQFDTNGATPFSVTLGAGQVIQGWDTGIVGMQVGGVRRLIIPPSMAY